MSELEESYNSDLSPEFVRKDIDQSISLRRDYYKFTAGAATALLAFTTAFTEAHSGLEGFGIVALIAWPALAISVFCAIFLNHIWAEFFITFRNLDNRNRVDEGRAARKRLNSQKRWLERTMAVSFFIGLVGVGLFGIGNALKM